MAVHDAVLHHQRANVHANLLWRTLSSKERDMIAASLDALRRLGYDASPFPEGDGITFGHSTYVEAEALEHVRQSFDWLQVVESSPGGDLTADLPTIESKNRPEPPKEERCSVYLY